MAEHAADTEPDPADPAAAPPASEPPPATGKQTRTGTVKGSTRLDTDTSAPSTTAPGDGPADTTDPSERATTVGGDKAAAAAAGFGTVNAAIPLPSTASTAASPAAQEHRVERYPATKPDGSTVIVEHNIDTGETRLTVPGQVESAQDQ